MVGRSECDVDVDEIKLLYLSFKDRVQLST